MELINTLAMYLGYLAVVASLVLYGPTVFDRLRAWYKKRANELGGLLLIIVIVFLLFLGLNIA